MKSLLDRYSLTHLPFGKDIAPDDLFQSSQLAHATQRLTAAVHARSSAVVSGEAGTGKTFVLRALEQQLQTQRVRFTYLHNSQVSHRDFYRQHSASRPVRLRQLYFDPSAVTSKNLPSSRSCIP